MGGLKPWGAIVYDKADGNWSMSWDGPTRKKAVAAAREKCKGSKCPYEISFFATTCGAFALGSGGAYSIVSRDDIHRTRQAALDDCGKRGKSSRSLVRSAPTAQACRTTRARMGECRCKVCCPSQA